MTRTHQRAGGANLPQPVPPMAPVPPLVPVPVILDWPTAEVQEPPLPGGHFPVLGHAGAIEGLFIAA